MGQQIVRQPDGRYAIFWSITDTIVLWDATEDEVVEFFVEQATKDARMQASRALYHVADGHPERAYYQFALTWDEALEKDREHGGDAWREVNQ